MSAPVRHVALVTVAVLAAYLVSCAFVPPGVPILLGGDQCHFWTYAQRMLEGQRVYRDFFQFTPPGTDLVYAAGFALFGPRIWVANAIVVLVGVTLAVLCFRIARGIVDDSHAALASAFFVVFVYGKAMNGTHHWFSVLAITSAIALVSTDWSGPKLAGAGALLGLASFFTQVHGVVALIAFEAAVSLGSRREGLACRPTIERCGLLLGGFVLGMASLNAYFIFTVGLHYLWHFQIVFVWEHIGRDRLWPDVGLGERPTWNRLPWLAPYLVVYATLPVVYGIVLHHCWRNRQSPTCKNWNTLALLSFVGVLLLLEVVCNLNHLRLFSVAMPGIILLPWALGHFGKVRRALVGAVWLGISVLAVKHVRTTYRDNSIVADLPAGTAATDSTNRDKLQWIAQRTTPGEFLFAPNWPSVHLRLRLRNPVFLDVIEASEQVRPEYVERSISELDARRVKYALLATKLYDLEEAAAAREDLVALMTYIHEHYRLVHVFADADAMWELK